MFWRRQDPSVYHSLCGPVVELYHHLGLVEAKFGLSFEQRHYCKRYTVALPRMSMFNQQSALCALELGLMFPKSGGAYDWWWKLNEKPVYNCLVAV